MNPLIETFNCPSQTIKPCPHNKEGSIRNCCVVYLQACLEAADEMLKTMDKNIDPCEDFYQYACGNFLRNAKIPDDKSSVVPPQLEIDEMIYNKVFHEQNDLSKQLFLQVLNRQPIHSSS